MVISGILLASRPEHLKEVCQLIDARPWADVQISEPSGRIIATIEADDIEQSMFRLAVLQALPDVLMAELAQYYIDGDIHGDIHDGSHREAEIKDE